jgi:hypothetical protein
MHPAMAADAYIDTVTHIGRNLLNQIPSRNSETYATFLSNCLLLVRNTKAEIKSFVGKIPKDHFPPESDGIIQNLIEKIETIECIIKGKLEEESG